MYIPHKFVAFTIASPVSSGILAPEKKAIRRVFPATKVTSHCVSSPPHSVFLLTNFLSPGTLIR